MRQGKKYKEDVHCDRIEDVFTYFNLGSFRTFKEIRKEIF